MFKSHLEHCLPLVLKARILFSVNTYPTDLCSHQHAEAIEPIVIGLQIIGFGHITSAL